MISKSQISSFQFLSSVNVGIDYMSGSVFI